MSAVNAEAVGDQIVVSGGWVASATSTSTYVYDAGSDTWTQAASAPTGVSASGTAVIDGIMYVIGSQRGRGEDDAQAYLADMRRGKRYVRDVY